MEVREVEGLHEDRDRDAGRAARPAFLGADRAGARPRRDTRDGAAAAFDAGACGAVYIRRLSSRSLLRASKSRIVELEQLARDANSSILQSSQFLAALHCSGSIARI